MSMRAFNVEGGEAPNQRPPQEAHARGRAVPSLSPDGPELVVGSGPMGHLRCVHGQGLAMEDELTMANTDTPQNVIFHTLVERLGAVTLPDELLLNIGDDAVACVEALKAAGYRITKEAE